MAMRLPRSQRWAAAAVAVLAVLVVLDLATGPQVLVIALYGIAPLLASFGTGWRTTGAVAVAALVVAAISRALTDQMDSTNGFVFLFTVAVLGVLACGGAAARARREATAARAGLLSEVGELLASAESPTAKLVAVAAAAVPAVADRCAIDLAGPTGEPERAAAIPGTPPPAVEQALTRVTRGAPPEASRAEIVVPLAARDVRLGALELGMNGSGRRFGADDRALAEELARRCAVALDSAQLLAEARAAEAELHDAYALLDAIFDRAPVGLAVHDLDLRYVRINDHMAEINGLSAQDHIGRKVSEVVPEVQTIEADLRRVLDSGRPLTELEVAGATAAAPGVDREWVVSYWPVRRHGDRRVVGVGAVVFEVTERRAAERELREQTARYESLLLALSEVGEAMVVLDDGRVEYANAAFQTICGYTTAELQAMPSVFDIVVEEQREASRRRARLRLEGELGPGSQLTICHRDGHRIPMEVAGVPLEVGGRQQMVVVARDVTARARAEAERERLLQRAAFLAEASAAFDAELDEERTLDALARLSVRDLADTCVILLGGSVGAIRRVASVARDPADERNLRELVERYPFADRRSHPLLEVLATGRSRIYEHPEGARFDAQDARHRELVAQFASKCTLLVPVSARGRMLGVMALGFNTIVGEDHLSLFEDVARRAALAIDNARLYDERSHVAHTLQRSLLPPVLPQVPGMELAARYLAAGEGNEVGGDFYDCFPTRGGDWALVIGDVCGKGAEAAAVTALARYTVRASATLHSDRPQVVLQDLNDAIRREGVPASRFCTVLYIALSPRPDGVKACVATGGHPLPLLMHADGSIETAGRPGTLLGILPDPEIRTTEVDLAPGDTLVLYTDGVTEVSPLDDRFGPETLARFVAGCSGDAPPVLARRIEEQVLEVGGGLPRDDVAVVVLRVRPALDVPFVAEEPGVAASR
jgi:PAS domain S-box-containing protein